MTDPVILTEIVQSTDVSEAPAVISVTETTSVLTVTEDGTPIVCNESVEQILITETTIAETINILEEPVIVSELSVGIQGPPGFVWRGDYLADAFYDTSDVVHYCGKLYYCKASCVGVSVTNTSYWDILIDPSTTGDRYFHHQQITPSTVWTINHNMGKYPSVTVIDSAGSVVEGAVEHINEYTLKIYFSAAFGGDAYLN